MSQVKKRKVEASKPKKKTEYCYKLYRVKRDDGKSTTVSMDPVLVMRATATLGDDKAVGKVVREASLRYTKSTAKTNRSAFCSAQLLRSISGL
ncbi:hypothetical protein F6X40_17010 [Paraburkholderia sp. UCT31]|uniref:hypothetical protein n=1 Tax=Paraburkholderia sp. UCT31 TaxID=2615209 RepID=UPI001656027A|nr:hypothetical protein [Paraburkholderia sp. UCT31]MBC8738477.1 hypothetical protein [Paraburkholderia sp. UCT31]